MASPDVNPSPKTAEPSPWSASHLRERSDGSPDARIERVAPDRPIWVSSVPSDYLGVLRTDFGTLDTQIAGRPGGTTRDQPAELQ